MGRLRAVQTMEITRAVDQTQRAGLRLTPGPVPFQGRPVRTD